ncbi:putative GH family 25 lysozyme 4 [Psilocybe cubensis]|uniref:Glycoside hydrolase family 25 protein n=2 Tax=Psilocybe cubensis TaxID=181762 RepID=A0A8H7XRG3_PSICU|nr:putative GH family 25 lysozyme 4 [Psilocybe cubensis]KAH9474380.1 putative GH family 25 lysozyme 4 [Psilocybe cubensis]
MFRSLILLPALVASSYALVSAVDSSTLVPKATYVKALGEGFTKAIIRGYSEACGIGGEVDPNFVGSYNNARAAGYTDIDTYWFPCNGSGNNCKSYATQLSEIAATFKAHSMKIGTIWIDLEKDSAICNNWNYGTAGNQAQAKSLLAAMKATGFNFGIYSTPGEWSTLFGSTSFVLDSSAPLWFATFNNVKTLTLGTHFGGQVQ